ncbi:F-box and WD repeat domain containing protein 10B-like [Styela clava]
MSSVELNTKTCSIDSMHEPNIQKLHHVFHETEGWLLRAGKSVVRKFFLSLIQEIEDVNVIQRLIILFSSASQKDYVYTRSRSNPGLPADIATKSFNKEFSFQLIKKCAADTLNWYRETDDHCKITFLLYIANLCVDTGIAHQACNLCKTLLNRRNVQIISKYHCEKSTDDSDSASINSSVFSYHTDEHPELYQLAAVVSEYGDMDLSSPHSDTHSNVGHQKSSPTIRKHNRFHYEEDISSIDTSSHDDHQPCLISTSYSALSGISPCRDFIGLLPVHLSKNILGMLSRSDLSSCALVHSRWHQLVSQVRKDEFSLQIIKEEAILMQGVSAKGSNPNYAKIQKVLVPVVDEVTQDIVKKSIHADVLAITPRRDGQEQLFESIYRGLETKYVEVEERNVYCGAYNLLVLDQRSNANRVISYAGEDNLVIGFADKIVRTVDVSSGREKKPIMQGHPASITSLYMGNKEQGSVFSGSYDTTIRKWNVTTGSCQLIMHGHRSSITSFDLFGDLLVSGARDGLVKIWNTATGSCTCTFKHSKKFSVTCVQMRKDRIVSSCEKGLVKVWNLKTRKMVKVLKNHGGMKVNCVRFNDYFLLSGGNDDYLLLWSMPGRQSICLKSYRHPKAVLCIELRYMCAITGCADGKIRVINMLSGDCLRVLRGNSQCDPIINIFATEDRLLVNTCSNCLVMHFEPITLEYNSSPGQINTETHQHARVFSKRPISSTIHSVNRANRFNLTNSADKRIFQRTSSAPPKWMKKDITKPFIHSAPGVRPPSHYIDLQPEFRRPRSNTTMSVTSMRPYSSASHVNSKSGSRVVSACSRISNISSKTRVKIDSSSMAQSLPPDEKKFGNKHSITTRDKLLMRVGMLSHVKKKERHNENTENNSISYFDRFYPRREYLEKPSSTMTYPVSSAMSKFSKISVGKFSTEEDEIKEVKSVFKEPISEELTRRHSSLSTWSRPSLDPLRRNFRFVNEQDHSTQTVKPVKHLQIDNFLAQQLGITY